MQFSMHETDLYILPETTRETNNLQSYCKTKKLAYMWQYSDVSGQAWHGKQFLEIPFRSDLLKEIKAYFK